jgi:GNAT superfamily N-acetyltransferase
MTDLNKYKLEDFRCESENIDLDYYIKFRDSVRARMEHPEWLGEIPKEGLEGMLGIGGKIWMYYLDDVPVCTWMFIPAGEDAKEDLEIEGIDYNLMADIGPVFVNFDYLGHGLMYQMLQKFDEYLESIGYKYVMTTVHPDNIFSSRNMVKNGMKKVSQKVFKRGPRDIYFKELD